MVATIIPTTALVLAGGKGERLRPLTDDRPKPMVEVNGRPILEHHLEWLHRQGVQRAVLLTGYLGDVVEDHFATARIPGLTVECLREDRPLGRGGALRRGFEEAGVAEGLVIATNGDVLTAQSFAPMLEAHDRTRALATVLLKELVSPYGIVDLDDKDLIRQFEEKPTLPYWFNAGVYVLSAELFARFPVQGDHETLLFPALAKEGRIAGFRCSSFWQSVESQKDLREAGELLRSVAAS